MASLARIAALPQGAMQIVGRGWFHLLGGLMLAVVAPAFIRYDGNPGFPQPGSAWNTIVGITLAVSVGFHVLTKVTRFPEVRATSYVFPCFVGTYGVVLLIFFFFRIDYARSLFLGSFILCVIWFFHAILLTRLRTRAAFAVIPIGSVGRLRGVRTADFSMLASPVFPERLPDALIADFRADLPGEWEHFIADWVLGGRPAYHVKDAMEMLTGRVDIEHLSENSFGSLDPALGYRNIKRVLDVLIAILLLPAFFLLTLVVGAAIMLGSSGPVFFRQERVGYRGRLFKVLKFRTMTHVPDVGAGSREAAMTRAADPRVTRVGRVLRRSRIDEIPQLFNVLKGEMSWIGPRPEAKPLSTWYGEELPFYSYRHIVRPGITGWAQVNQGHVVDMQDVLGKLHYDFYYIKYFSPWLDVFIAIRTLWIMAGGQGSR
ncbi:MAG: sugar transferase [Aurantimonas endophytica]|uniref:sugar transferase n=1 Tax=Aurantimonas endophytica TaxID=1522175 RepID=UPI0030015905